MPTIASFNANNFFLRYKFNRTYPGDRSKQSLVEASEVAMGYLQQTAFGRYTKGYIVWDAKRRLLAARALREPDDNLPDILCFQEVENIQAIRIFNQRYLGSYYPYSLLIDAYDPRNIDVGLLSRFPITEIRSHIDELDDNGNRVFSRDCLEAEIELPEGSKLTLLLNHLKSKLVIQKEDESTADYHDRILDSHKRRLAQAKKVVEYVEERFRGQHTQALYAVIGDFNDTPYSPWLAPLLNCPLLTDLVSAHRPLDDRWTYYWRGKGTVSQIDYILASQALSSRVHAIVTADAGKRPHIERRGLAYRKLNASDDVLPKKAKVIHFEADPVTPQPNNVPVNTKVNFRHLRYAEVMGNWKSNISDHCPVKVWF